MTRSALALLAACLFAGPAAADVIVVVSPNDGPLTDYGTMPPTVNPLDTFFAPQGVTLSTVGGQTSNVYGITFPFYAPDRAFGYNDGPMSASDFWGRTGLALRADLSFLAAVAVVAFAYDDSGSVGPPVLSAYGDGGVFLGSTMDEFEIDGVRQLRFDAGDNRIRYVTAAYSVGGISDDARFLAFGFGVRDAAVPEPATLAVVGLLGVGGWVARRRR